MKMRSKMQNEKGFTLVELMVVVVILGILVAIAVPVYKNITEKAAIKAHDANVRTLIGAATTAVATNDLPPGGSDIVWPTTASGDWDYNDFLQEWPDVPTMLKGTGNVDADATYVVTITSTGGISCVPSFYEE